MEVSTVMKEKENTSPLRLGMVLFLISEAFLFGSLFSTYYYLRAEAPVWPPPGVRLDSTLAIINTVLLLSSSGAIYWAGRAIRKDNGGRPGDGIGGDRRSGSSLPRYHRLRMDAARAFSPGRAPMVRYFTC